MSPNWPTQAKDLLTARVIMEEYANEHDRDSLGLFEIVVSQVEKKMDYRLSGWVVLLSKHFASLYGAHQGDYVTRRVISHCITQNATLH